MRGSTRSRLVVAAIGAMSTALAGAALLLTQASDPAEAIPVPRPRAATLPAQVIVGPIYPRAQLGPVATYRPAGPIRGVALFLSGDGGWNQGVVGMARALARNGVAVAGISTPTLLKAADASADTCVNPNFALAALAQDFEHRLAMPRYLKPVLVGYSSGATVAYAALAQGPAGAWRGAVSLGFGPDLPGAKAWCAGSGLKAVRITRPERGWLFRPTPLPAPWVALQGAQDQVVSPASARAFVAQLPGARLVELPAVGHGFSVAANWMPQFLAAVLPMLDGPAAGAAPTLPSVADLPLTVVADPRGPATRVMAVMFSGDGGWAGLDRDVAAGLARAGVPVVGLDSLDYFWTARSPQATAADLARVLDHYGRAWGRDRVLLLGYSFGANVLPETVGALPPATRARIARLSLLGLSASADFQFHLANWLDIASSAARPTAPALARLRGMDLQCVRGRSETDSACPGLPVGLAQQVVLPGGHHFDGNAGLVATTVLKGLSL